MTQQTLTTSQVSQLRRNARRLARDQGITHTQALDRLALERGFKNWSLLARNVPCEDGAAAADTPAAAGAPAKEGATAVSVATGRPGRPRMDASRAEMASFLRIAQRYENIVGIENVSRLDLLMDLEACHCNGCPLDLDWLESARDFDFVHDVAGIQRYLDRETGQLTQCFRPRYAA